MSFVFPLSDVPRARPQHKLSECVNKDDSSDDEIAIQLVPWLIRLNGKSWLRSMGQTHGNYHSWILVTLPL
jgi:hypothetical protein